MDDQKNNDQTTYELKYPIVLEDITVKHVTYHFPTAKEWIFIRSKKYENEESLAELMAYDMVQQCCDLAQDVFDKMSIYDLMELSNIMGKFMEKILPTLKT